MSRVLGLFAAIQFLVVSTAAAEDLVRDASALEQIKIQGVSLSMTAEQAFDELRAAGFRAGNINAYGDWNTDGIEFVRGTYGSPDGHSSVSMTRRGDRLVNVSESYNAPGAPLDANAEINSVKNQLALPAETNRCGTNSANGGTCQVQDAEAAEDVNIHYTLQILSTMRLVTITRTKELK